MTSADHDSLRVVALAEDREFTDKDAANFSVLVYDKGVLVDSDSPPNVTVGYGPDQRFPVTRVATGIYNGTVDMATLWMPFGNVYIKANATLGKNGPDDTVYNEAEGFGLIVLRSNATTGYRMHLYLKEISDGYVKPGTRVTFGVQNTYNGKLVDPGGQYYATHFMKSDDPGSEKRNAVQATRLSVGEYEYKFTVPDVNSSGLATFYAECTYNGQEKYDWYYLPVDFFSVVFHNTTRTANGTGFELYIGDDWGAPVVGATIEMEYAAEYLRYEDRPKIRGRTNSTGVASMTFGHPQDAGDVYLYGYANASGKSQYFDHDLFISGSHKHEGSHGNVFEVDVTGGFEAPPPGQVMYRDCYAYNNSSVWANQTVYCFVLTGFFDPMGHLRQLTHVEIYTCITDELGMMTIPVTVPAWTNWELDLEFVSATGVHPKPGENGSDHDSLDGLNYSSQGHIMGFEVPSLLLCESLGMHLGDFQLGAPVSVWGNATARDLPVGQIAWDFGDSPNMADWQVLVQLWRYMPSSGARYCGTAVLPSFLPAGLNYTVYGYVENDVSGWRYDVASPLPGQTGNPPTIPPDGRPGLSTVLGDGMCLATGIAIVLASLGAAFVLWYIKRDRIPPEFPPQGPVTL